MTHDRFVFGLTLDQIDELNRLTGMITAHGDMIAIVGGNAMDDHSLHTLGDAVFSAGLAVREILDQVDGQRLEEAVGEYRCRGPMPELRSWPIWAMAVERLPGVPVSPLIPAEAGDGFR